MCIVACRTPEEPFSPRVAMQCALQNAGAWKWQKGWGAEFNATCGARLIALAETLSPIIKAYCRDHKVSPTPAWVAGLPQLAPVLAHGCRCEELPPSTPCPLPPSPSPTPCPSHAPAASPSPATAARGEVSVIDGQLQAPEGPVGIRVTN
jgi:hypothetical protein